MQSTRAVVVVHGWCKSQDAQVEGDEEDFCRDAMTGISMSPKSRTTSKHTGPPAALTPLASTIVCLTSNPRLRNPQVWFCPTVGRSNRLAAPARVLFGDVPVCVSPTRNTPHVRWSNTDCLVKHEDYPAYQSIASREQIETLWNGKLGGSLTQERQECLLRHIGVEW